MRTMAEGAAEPMLATASLGELLVADRIAVGVELDELSRQSGFELGRIEAVESGRHDLTDIELCQLLDRYSALSSARLASSRRPFRALVEIDLDAGSLRLRRTRRPRALPAADRNLLHYLSMVHRHNDLRLGTEIPLKAVDLNLLRASLALRRNEVASRVDRMTGRLGPGLTANRSILAVAVATGLVVAAGAIVLIPMGRSANEPTSPPGAIDPRIDIGTPLVIERAPSEILGFDGTNGPDPGADPGTGPGPDSVERDQRSWTGLDLDADLETGSGPIGAIAPSAQTGSIVEGAATRPVTTSPNLGWRGPRGPPAVNLMISS
jgi:hypothetical protein